MFAPNMTCIISNSISFLFSSAILSLLLSGFELQQFKWTNISRVFLQYKFTCLLAALEAPRVLNLNSREYYSGPYGEDVVFVANDWHTALISCYLKSVYKPNGIYKSAKVAFYIHNISYQGRYAISDFSLLNLPNEFKSSFDFIDGYV
ncbi:granule-bound starch synthase 1, chloroplastic/amyloplastic-like [Magnolia sinica]|uniref:granule-bound starch synthase 1, chloroplastic/amyloplastic-like n=1 Tax=Magnolia sinica TaxID=86752 RepID=UPI00265AFCEA|nr:granule-bound starch synthase 1, chloroplastic/amyloplastic-like [Magnolia sinica]